MGRRVHAAGVSGAVPLALTRSGASLSRALQQTRWALPLLALTAWIVFAPGLNRVFVVDQLWYFAELDGDTSLSAGLRHYDYAASRQYWKGDDALFRPLVFVWLAIGNTLFSYHHAWWNVATLAMHVLVAVCLFQLLNTIRPSPFALLAAMLFIVMKPGLELVLWNHLGGYLLAWAFLLIGLRCFVTRVAVEDNGWFAGDAVYIAVFTAACLSYEAMAPITGLAGVLLGWRAWRSKRLSVRRVVVLSAPVVLFVALYGLHVQRVARLDYVDRPDTRRLADAAGILRTIPASLTALGRWTVEVTQPSTVRFDVTPYYRAQKATPAPAWPWPRVVDVTLAGSGLLLLGFSLTRTHLRRVAPLLTLLACAMFVYTMIICLGRPLVEVLGVTYFAYPFCLLLVVILYTVSDGARIRGWRSAAPALVVLALVWIHGAQTHAAAQVFGRANEVASTYLTAVSGFVDERRTDPAFSFRIADPPRLVDPEIDLIVGYPDRPASPPVWRRVTEILFARYYREESETVFRWP